MTATNIPLQLTPFPSEGAIMSLLLSQHKLIEWLENQWGKKLWDVKNGNDTTGPSSVTIEKYPFIYIV
ncbi:MAG: hypothetical protein WBF33_19840 [Candidatus Nitrosopolaris sp.]